MKLFLAVSMMLFFLSGCVGANFDKKSSSATAPIVVQYSKAKQLQARSELLLCSGIDQEKLEKIGEDKCPIVRELMKDYKNMRDQSRILKGENVTE